MTKMIEYFSKIDLSKDPFPKVLIGVYSVFFVINIFSKDVGGLVKTVLFLILVLIVMSLEWDAEDTAKVSIYPFSAMIILSAFSATLIAERFAVLSLSLLAISVFKKTKRFLTDNSSQKLET